MKKTRILALLLAVVMLVALLGACGPTTPAVTTPPADATDAQTTPPAEGTTPPAPGGELKDLPPMNYKFNTSGTHQKVAEVLQNTWKTALGLDVTVESMEWAVFQTARTEGDFEIARHGWLGDYNDPMTFLDMWVTESGQNDAKFSNAEYDQLIMTAKNSGDNVVRMDAMHKAEKLLMESFSVIPIYFYTHPYLSNDKVKDYYDDPLLNHLGFKRATKVDGSPILYNLGATPKSLDPQLNNATDGANVIQECFDGLTRKNAKGIPEPGIAEKWVVSDDQLVWTFTLRDAKWSDGVAVKAQDFVYGMRRCVDPTVGSEYAYQAFYIKNGQEISEGKMAVDQLGVKAVDEKTLEITLAAPCAYFLEMVAFPSLYPVREDIVSANADWALKPETYVTNGAYKMTEYVAQDRIVLEKSDSYWDSANMKCPKVINILTDDGQAALMQFESGELDFVENIFPPDETQRMKDAGFFRLGTSVGTYFLVINLKKNNEALLDPRVREAIALSIDREYIIEVVQNNATPAYAFVCPGMTDSDGKDFRENGGNFFGTGSYEQDVARARELLVEAGYNPPQ